jgi:triosephosphate isomerase
MGAKAVLVGHSERRALFKESNEFLKKKVDSAIEEGLLVFFCCGETLEERKRNEHKSVVKEQIASALFHLAPDQWKNIVIAYEPVWAIGTGETASSEQAEEMHAFIRNQVELAISKEVANELSILYGGSCKPTNAEELFAQNNIDGGLIGGASLKSADFEAIIKSF